MPASAQLCNRAFTGSRTASVWSDRLLQTWTSMVWASTRMPLIVSMVGSMSVSVNRTNEALRLSLATSSWMDVAGTMKVKGSWLNRRAKLQGFAGHGLDRAVKHHFWHAGEGYGLIAVLHRSPFCL